MAQNNWLTPTMKEAPFYYDGITPEEYEKENRYLQTHYDKLLNRTYKPLWQQKQIIA